MAFNYYLGWSENDLLAERLRVQRELRKMIVGTAAGEVNVNRIRESSAVTTLSRIGYSLYIIDPDKYPLQLRNNRVRAVWA